MVGRKNLFSSSEEALPDITIIMRDEKQTTQDECSFEIGTDEAPPRILMSNAENMYQNAADAYLRGYASVLSKEPASPLLWDRLMGSEADKAFRSGMHLLYPIIAAFKFDEKFRGKVHASQEFNIKPLRVDVAFSYTSNGDSKAVLMIEFKKANLIDTRQFEIALWEMSDLDKSCMPLMDDRRRYLLAGEAEEKLTKQAANERKDCESVRHVWKEENVGWNCYATCAYDVAR